VNPITVTMDADHSATAHYYVPGVGGEWTPIQTVQTIVPYILLSLALASALTAGSWRRFKKR